MKKPIGKLLAALSAALCLLSVPAFAANDVAINEDNFPDDIFRSYVSENFDTDGNGSLSAEEISAAQVISVSDKSIQSLKGIEHFDALIWLYCDSNQLTELDVSKNTALVILDCDSNQLMELDVSRNNELWYLTCDSNQLTELDVSRNTALWLLSCSRNQLTEVDVSKNTALEILGCNYNQLTELDVSRNTALWQLSCGSNQLTELDVSKNAALEELDCRSNQLTEVDVSRNSALWDLTCNDNQLTELDVSKNTALKDLFCGDNQLTGLDVSKNTALEKLWCANNQLTDLDVSGNTALESLLCDGNQLTELNTSENAALKTLWCTDNQLTELDVSGSTALEDLLCSGNQLRELDISENAALKNLWCYDNQLTGLDVSKNTALTMLLCNNNQLTELDVSKNTALEYLDCYSNQLTELDMSKNTALTSLSCDTNQLTELDVSKNTALTQLACFSNQLTELDISKNTALTMLLCNINQLTGLDVSKNTALEYLYCYSNQLTSLDVSNNTALSRFDCDGNKYAITLDEGNKFDLSTLPGFDVSKASNWAGGTVDGTVLTADATSVTYDYDCGGGRATTFTLMVASVDHTALARVDAKAATCTEDGNREYWHCSECGKNFLDEAGTEEAMQADIVIPALGHSFTNYVYNNDAEAGVDGTETAHCDRDGCDATDTRTAEGTALPNPEKTEFKDVATDAYYAPAVAWAVENGVVYGTSDTTFSPDEKCTRAHVVAFLWRAKGKPEPSTTENPFTDVTANDYYYEAVLWAVENGIVYGTSDTTFEPNSPCTRAQVAAFLYRAEKKPEPTTDSNPFTDVKSGEYYEKAVIWAVENGIVYGTSDTTFEPNATCTRAQGVAFLYRAYGK